ncbi:DUF551 domain-containing protein [Erwinia sp. V90_4]|uniref:DUF551 domain-containing protein n=1 Tax=Erwinia sp. V90_4 TaxID=3044239 RepID=UPI00249F7CF6|nr:DUF551 domain-containing protein [Erwinia sp. V90_4]MDI3440370.1 DUF551 domain-containing protein [Erwinia sp. V90_4]
MSNWIKCSERMPPKGKTVLVWYLGDWEFGMTFGAGIMSIYEGGGWTVIKVDTNHQDINWQPLPPPPEE